MNRYVYKDAKDKKIEQLEKEKLTLNKQGKLDRDQSGFVVDLK